MFVLNDFQSWLSSCPSIFSSDMNDINMCHTYIMYWSRCLADYTLPQDEILVCSELRWLRKLQSVQDACHPGFGKKGA
jgi:hypothetical protein